MTTVTPQQLNQFLTRHFNLGELRTLCFEINIDYEDLEGGTRDQKTLALVAYAQRHGLFDTLAAHAQAKRPNASLTDAKPSPQTGPVPTSQPATTHKEYHFHGNVIGSAIDSGTINASHVAGRDINHVAGDMPGGDIIHNTGQGNFINKPQGDVNLNQGSGTQNVQKAGRDINYGGQPQDKAAFIAQLAELRSLLEQAIAAKEVKPDDATTLTEDLAEVTDRAQAETPNVNRIRRRLEDMAETLQATTQVATATGTAATAVAKAALIVNGLVQTVATIFS